MKVSGGCWWFVLTNLYFGLKGHTLSPSFGVKIPHMIWLYYLVALFSTGNSWRFKLCTSAAAPVLPIILC